MNSRTQSYKYGNVSPHNTGVTLRNMDFCLRGLKEVQAELADLNIGFDFVRGWELRSEDTSPGQVLGKFLVDNHPGAAVVVDFSPLRQHRGIVDDLVECLPKQTVVYQVRMEINNGVNILNVI